MERKFLVYTALFGDIDTKLHEHPNPALDDNHYICFTNRQDLTSKIWDIIYLPENFLPQYSDRMKARFLKIMLPNLGNLFHFMNREECFPHYGDCFLWVDTSLMIRCNPSEVAKGMKSVADPLDDFDIMAFHHPDRVALEDEAKAAHKWRGTSLELANKQITWYRNMGFTKEIQKTLTSTGFLFRQQSKDLKKFCQYWWNQLLLFTDRDQLSVDFCAYSTRMRIKYLPDCYRKSPLVRFHAHKAEKPKK